jgi:hypothetical protein
MPDPDLSIGIGTTVVTLAPGAVYELIFGYTGLNNYYASTNALTNGSPSPHPANTGSVCRAWDVVFKVHRGDNLSTNNDTNLMNHPLVTFGPSTSGASFPVFHPNMAAKACFRASTSPANPPNSNEYTVSVYARNLTKIGGTGLLAPADLIFDSLWWRLVRVGDLNPPPPPT